MKNTREWMFGGVPNLHYYIDLTGRIVGETSIIGTGNYNKYSCVVYPNPSDSISLGMYISSDKAKMAIERYWSKEDDVYDMINDKILSK
jgi:hypothetical protein